MFNQIKDLAGGEFYLISSLIMFMLFFVIVGIYLLRLNKSHMQAMRNLPIEDLNQEVYEED